MTDNLDNKMAIKDVKATSDEAARLLASLEGEPKQQVSNHSRKGSVHKYRKFDQEKSINAEPTINLDRFINQLIVFIGILISPALLFYFASYLSISPVETSGNEIESNPTTTKIVKDEIESNPTTTKIEKNRMSTYQKSIYNKALTAANNAILKKEHESAMLALKRLQRSEYEKLEDVNQVLINNKIIQAKKEIKFLDQPGESNYWEGADYGYQWFDEMANNQFRVFFAYSKRCANPLVTFAYRPPNSSRSSNPVRIINIIPKTYTSTIVVPAYRGNSLWVDYFRCN